MKIIGYCKMCRYWNSNGEPGIGTQFECTNKMVRDNYSDDGCSQECSYGCSHQIFTGPNFGCVHYTDGE